MGSCIEQSEYISRTRVGVGKVSWVYRWHCNRFMDLWD